MKLSKQQKNEIVQAIALAEKETSGEIRVHLAYSHCDDSALPLAQKQFEKLGMHQTKERNGVLLYVNPKARKFALYGDQGIHEKLGQQYWDSLKNDVSAKIQSTDLTQGICHAVKELGFQLQKHFPYQSTDRNELNNDVSESE